MPELASILTVLALMTNAPSAAKIRAPGDSGTPGVTGVPFVMPAASNPAEAAYRRLLALDDVAHKEIDDWILEADARGNPAEGTALQKRIDERIAGVEKAYRAFFEQHPDHVQARIAFGSFLNDTGQEFAARDQWEKALALDPSNPAIHNNLAGYYGHRGPVTNAFAHFEKAIELDPKEAVYRQNLATTVFLFRKDALEHYGLRDEQLVFDKALGLYRQALELDPENFLLAEDLAQTYYGIKPARHADALAAWRKAFALAGDDVEREGVRLHLARIQVQAGLYDEARTNLTLVTNASYAVVKTRIVRTLEAKQHGENVGADASLDSVTPEKP